ncbi:MAG: ThiF family adenylyltransferase [Opitutae bacterium]|nr:ThiF family adenylyltransferase [Opitutae bacterium]
MFELADQPIDSAAWRTRLAHGAAGALVVFEGWVRNHHLGRPVTELEYEAFDAHARLEGEAIIAEVEQDYPGCRVCCVHRTGRLRVGELSVWIGAAAPHRAAAFLACRQVIEELKRRLPVWKKEHHPDGATEWVNCTAEAATSRLSPETYHARQIALPEVGAAGQAALAAASLLVVGVGGLGCPAALYLATAGLGRLTLADGGLVELSNLHRQILFTADEVGVAKATAAAARLKAHNPLARIEAFATRVTPLNVRTLVAGRTAVLDCTDNFTARFLLHDACRAAGVPLVSAAVHRFEGELTVYAPGTPGCLHCQWPAHRPAELDATGDCASGPVFAPTVGVLGVMQAAEALKLILRTPGADFRHTRLLNLLDASVLAVERTANPSCPVCGQPAIIRSDRTPSRPDVILTEEAFVALGPVRTAWLLEAGETARAGFPGAECVLAGDVLRLRELAAAGPLVLACRSGVRSAALARLLRAEGMGAVFARAVGAT